jgi:predicted transcriptional regulator
VASPCRATPELLRFVAEIEEVAMGRRPDGALELDVLGVLWRAAAPMTPGEVRDTLGLDLAYTTVMTVLGRLHDKGLVRRDARGRAFAYEAMLTESELTARRMGDVLSVAADRAGALSGFVGKLSKRDLAALRRALDDSGR